MLGVHGEDSGYACLGNARQDLGTVWPYPAAPAPPSRTTVVRQGRPIPTIGVPQPRLQPNARRPAQGLEALHTGAHDSSHWPARPVMLTSRSWGRTGRSSSRPGSRDPVPGTAPRRPHRRLAGLPPLPNPPPPGGREVRARPGGGGPGSSAALKNLRHLGQILPRHHPRHPTWTP